MVRRPEPCCNASTTARNGANPVPPAINNNGRCGDRSYDDSDAVPVGCPNNNRSPTRNRRTRCVENRPAARTWNSIVPSPRGAFAGDRYRHVRNCGTCTGND